MNGQTRTPDIWQVLAGELTLEDLDLWQQRQKELEAMRSQQTPLAVDLVQLRDLVPELLPDEQRSRQGAPGAALMGILGGKGLGVLGRFGSAGGAGAGIPGFCWVAAAIYGDRSPEFVCAWLWLNHGWQGRIAEMVRSVYGYLGPRLAPHIARHRWLRWALRPLFDVAVRRGAAVLLRSGPSPFCPLSEWLAEVQRFLETLGAPWPPRA